MRIRSKRSLQDLCHVTPTLSQPQIAPVLRGNFRMQGSSGEANYDSLTNMVASESSSHCSCRSSKVDHRGKSGTCNVCSALCSSCFHGIKVLLKSNNDQVGETCAGNTETGPLSILSTVGGMDSTADSFYENAAGKASSRTSNASVSDDSVMHSKCDGRRSPEGHDDCLSCVSGTDEQLNRQSDIGDTDDNYNKQIAGEIYRKMSPTSSQTGIYTLKSGIVGYPLTKSTNDATDLQKDQNNSDASNDKNVLHEESPMNVDDDKPSDTNLELFQGSTEHFNSSSPNVASDDVCGDPPKTDLISTDKNGDIDIEVHPGDESDDSDMVEEDVKVCDICGDAGREDLLAICSRCSDGAEHTYCMRERQEKLPEGEWLCEECKTMELVGNGKQEKVGNVDENEKNNSSGQVSENLDDSDVEGPRTKSSTKKLSKRLRDDEDAEVSSIAKRPTLESAVGLPKTSIPKLAVLSRDISVKSLDKGTLHSPNRSSSDTIPVNNTTELPKPASDARGLHLRGTFSKSNSFNSLNSKPKVKLVDQVIQRQKSAKEHGSFRPKEGGVRSIGKSVSFRSTNPSRSESKIKMLSPRPLHTQDVKSTKEKGAFERQRSFRLEHPSNRRPSSRIESSSLASPSNHYDAKPVQTDGKSAGLLRSSSFAARRNTDLSGSTGEFKRPSKHGHSIPVLSSANGVNNTEQKHNQTSLKQDPASCDVSKRLPSNASEGVSDGSIQSKDLTDSIDRTREYSGSRLVPPSVRSSRDESDNLKAAIEAAVLRKPGVYRKKRAFGQSDESSVPAGAPVASHVDHMARAKYRKLSYAELTEKPPVSQNLTSDPLKEEALNSVKQFSLVHAEGLYTGDRDGARFGLSSRDTLSNVPAVVPLSLKSIAIPEHEYIWQGSFEICRSGQTVELWDGIQAHLSTCASPKVVEAVNKFKNRSVVYEVPRLSTWPVQFQENGVRDDNIALFFFAKDLQSHDKIYKVLLDKMMKNDFALRGCFNGVELLIFPSNQLPVHMQRWNMSFFLWGVFRGKKEHMQQIPESTIVPTYIPPPIMSLPGNRCSPAPITDNASQDIHPGVEVTGSEELRDLPGAVKRDVDIDVSPLDQIGDGLNFNSSFAVQSDGAKQCGGVMGSYQEGGISSSCSLPVAMKISNTGREKMLTDPVTPLGNPHSPQDSCKMMAGMSKEAGGGGATVETICHQSDSKSTKDIIHLSRDADIPLENDRGIRDLNLEPDRWLFSEKEQVLPGPSPLGNHTICAGTAHVSPRIYDTMHNGTVRRLEKISHVPTSSCTLQSEHSEAAGVGTIPKYNEHGERYLFPVESRPMKGLPLTDGSMPWKMHLQDEDRPSDRAPNLELALGAEREPLALGIEPLFFSRVEHKVHDKHIVEEVGKKKVEEDVSASLSLSLSLPFPEKEVDAMSQRKHVNTSSSSSSSSRLLFGNLREN